MVVHMLRVRSSRAFTYREARRNLLKIQRKMYPTRPGEQCREGRDEHTNRQGFRLYLWRLGSICLVLVASAVRLRGNRHGCRNQEECLIWHAPSLFQRCRFAPATTKSTHSEQTMTTRRKKRYSTLPSNWETSSRLSSRAVTATIWLRNRGLSSVRRAVVYSIPGPGYMDTISTACWDGAKGSGRDVGYGIAVL